MYTCYRLDLRVDFNLPKFRDLIETKINYMTLTIHLKKPGQNFIGPFHHWFRQDLGVNFNILDTAELTETEKILSTLSDDLENQVTHTYCKT
jgi:hypothetical protein